ncbi:MAG: FtsL-like putative cell division protein [Bacteroidota bacterium]
MAARTNRRRSNARAQQSNAKKKGLSIRNVDGYLRFMIFLTMIGMAYIWNSHIAERQIDDMETYRQEVKELKSQYLLEQATLSAGTRFSEIKPMADTLGLKPLGEPPLQLVNHRNPVANH